MTLIGMAEYSPAIPTSGAEIAPRTNGSNPRRADALPAICACFSIASANDDVEIIPTDETKKKMGMITATSGPLKSTTINKMILDTLDIINPIFKKVFPKQYRQSGRQRWFQHDTNSVHTE